MNPQQIFLVQSSFASVVPIADAASVIFYDELFEGDPSLRPLFKDDITEQRRKLMMMLGMAVNGLSNWDATSAVVRSLGERHVGYGVQKSHYDTVGAALIATLEKGLGDAFTPEVRDAWIACYGLVSTEMIDAMDAAAA
jgi:hemoglobin-like flavoprotein